MVRSLPLVEARTEAAPAPGASLPPERCEALVTVFKALGDPVRLQLFASIAASPDTVCVCNIPDVGVSQPTVSHHLRKLREAGLLESERRGTWVHYRVTSAGRQLAATMGAI